MLNTWRRGVLETPLRLLTILLTRRRPRSSPTLKIENSALQHFRVLARMTPGLKEEVATLLMEAGKTVLM